jgi:hypothetical protein
VYLSDVPTVDLDPRVAAVANAGVPDVQQMAYTPNTFSVRLPSFGKPRLTTAEMLAIGGAALLFLFAGRRR